jgi:hypothetical protein
MTASMRGLLRRPVQKNAEGIKYSLPAIHPLLHRLYATNRRADDHPEFF